MERKRGQPLAKRTNRTDIGLQLHYNKYHPYEHINTMQPVEHNTETKDKMNIH